MRLVLLQLLINISARDFSAPQANQSPGRILWSSPSRLLRDQGHGMKKQRDDSIERSLALRPGDLQGSTEADWVAGEAI